MQHILVLTDFSPTSEKAFIFATALARRSGGSLTLYHGYKTIESNFVASEKERDAYNKQTAEDVEKKLQRLGKKIIGDDAGLRVSYVAGESPLIENVMDYIQLNNIDLIVMGTQGASGIKKALIGSIASRVIDKTNIPLMLIPEKYEWATPGRILIASNYLETDKLALAVATRIAQLFEAVVTVVHLYEVYNMDEEKERAVFDGYSKELMKAYPDANMNFEFIVTPSITETMEKLCTQIPYDIMTIVRRKKTLLERFFVNSFSKNMAYVTEQPLLIVPEK